MIISLVGLLGACGNDNSKSTSDNTEKNSNIETRSDETSFSTTKNDLTVKVKNNKIDENNEIALNINSQADFSKIYKNVEELIN